MGLIVELIKKASHWFIILVKILFNLPLLWIYFLNLLSEKVFQKETNVGDCDYLNVQLNHPNSTFMTVNLLSILLFFEHSPFILMIHTAQTIQIIFYNILVNSLLINFNIFWYFLIGWCFKILMRIMVNWFLI